MTTSNAVLLTRRERIIRAMGIGLFLAGGILLYQCDPAKGLGLTCPFHAATGLECFGCGLTRSLCSVLHGDIFSAMGYHALGPIVLGAAVVVLLVWLNEVVTGHRRSFFNSHTLRWGSFIGTGAVWVVYGVARMVVEISATWTK